MRCSAAAGVNADIAYDELGEVGMLDATQRALGADLERRLLAVVLINASACRPRASRVSSM